MTFGEMEYTPLNRGEGYIEFILGDNGTATISVDGSRFMSFEVEGNVVPEELPTYMELSQIPSVSIYTGNDNILVAREASTKCLNGPTAYNVDYPYYILRMRIADFTPNRLTCHNCVISASGAVSGGLYNTCFSVIETELPAYVELDGFIILVFNYTTE